MAVILPSSRLPDLVQGNSAPWNTLSDENAPDTALKIADLFTDRGIYYQRFRESTGEQTFENDLGVIPGKPLEVIVNFDRDEESSRRFVSVHFNDGDPEPTRIRLYKKEEFILEKGGQMPFLARRKFLFPSYNAVCRAIATRDQSAGRWHVEIYSAI